MAASLRAGVTLLAFYFSSSKLTTLMENLKDVDEGFKKGGQRNWIQVGSPTQHGSFWNLPALSCNTNASLSSVFLVSVRHDLSCKPAVLPLASWLLQVIK